MVMTLPSKFFGMAIVRTTSIKNYTKGIFSSMDKFLYSFDTRQGIRSCLRVSSIQNKISFRNKSLKCVLKCFQPKTCGNLMLERVRLTRVSVVVIYSRLWRNAQVAMVEVGVAFFVLDRIVWQDRRHRDRSNSSVSLYFFYMNS